MTAFPRAMRHFGAAMLEAEAAPEVQLKRAARVKAALRGGVLDAGPPPLRTRRITVRLWIPSTALFCLLAPFALLLAPLGYLSPHPYRIPPFAAAFAIGRLLISLGGSVVHVDTPEALISLRLF